MHNPITIQEAKISSKACECFSGSIVCGKRPAGEFMREGWPDSMILCTNCEADAHSHSQEPTPTHEQHDVYRGPGIDQSQLSNEAKLNNLLRVAWIDGAEATFRAHLRGDSRPECPYPLHVFKTRAIGFTAGSSPRDLRVFRLARELAAISREASEHAAARAKLVDELRAVRILDAWAKKNGCQVPGLYYVRDTWHLTGSKFEPLPWEKTPALARIAAAEALAKEDPSLLEGI